MNAGDAPTGKSRRNKWLLVAAIAVALLAALLIGARVALKPEHVTRLLLSQAGKALGLEITASGIGEYRLRGTPMLVVRGLDAREPGAKNAVLSAERAYIAVPWATLRGRGKLLDIQRIELDGPVFDMPAFQAWKAKRAPGETRIPTLLDGLRVRRGRLVNDDWRIEDLQIDLPALHPDRMLSARVRGRYLDPPLSVPADLAISIANPGRLLGNEATGIAATGSLAFEGEDWRMPAAVTLSGPLVFDADSLRIMPVKFGLSGDYASAQNRIPVKLGLHGPMVFDEATWTLAPAAVALESRGNTPPLRAFGTVALGRVLKLQLDGSLREWPRDWPALPQPIARSRSPIPYRVEYAGKIDLTDVLALQLRRDRTRFAGRMRVLDVVAWSKATKAGSPLPPLDGVLETPLLEIAGAKLHGVRIEVEDAAVPPATVE